MPALLPAFSPLTITSGVSGSNSKSASLTQSAGRPSTAQPTNVWPSSSNTSLTSSGLSSVTECPAALCSVAGATTVTDPSLSSSSRSARRPGA